MKIVQFLCLCIGLAGSPQARASDWSFLNTSLNYLDWSKPTEDRANAGAFGKKKAFAYVEVEGGRGGDWGDLYGFLDVENPSHQTHDSHDGRSDRRTAAKIVGRFTMTKIGNYPLMAYGHIYDFVDDGFGDQNRVLGLSTDIHAGDLVVKPFLGLHHEVKSNVGARSNGGMTGYVLYLPLRAFGQSFALSQWHETEFARRDEFLAFGGGESPASHRLGQNGAVALWWQFNTLLTAGISYRYADNKLGTAGYEDGFIYTLRLNL